MRRFIQRWWRQLRKEHVIEYYKGRLEAVEGYNRDLEDRLRGAKMQLANEKAKHNRADSASLAGERELRENLDIQLQHMTDLYKRCQGGLQSARELNRDLNRENVQLLKRLEEAEGGSKSE